MFKFDEETHKYTFNGEVIPSVTQLLAPLTDFSMVPEFLLEKKRQFGVMVHEGCEYIVKGEGYDPDQYENAEIECIEAFRVWWEGKTFSTNSHSEQKLLHKKLKYAGTADIIVDGFEIIDIKTRKFNPITDPIQLAAYEYLWTANGGKPGTYHRSILELIPGKPAKLVAANDKQAWSKFRFLLDHWWNCKKYEANIKAWGKK